MDNCLSVGHCIAPFHNYVFLIGVVPSALNLFFSKKELSWNTSSMLRWCKFLVQSHEQIKEFPDILHSFPKFVILQGPGEKQIKFWVSQHTLVLGSVCFFFFFLKLLLLFFPVQNNSVQNKQLHRRIQKELIPLLLYVQFIRMTLILVWGQVL